MRHSVAGRKLKRTASHKRALMCNLATSLFEHKRLVTTVAKAKELRPFAEQLITRARNAYNAEKAGSVGNNGVDFHSRRMVGRFIHNKAVLQELFDTIAPVVAERPGGYTRITKLGNRRGDAAPEAMIELVDWSNPQDGRVSLKTRAKAAPKPKKAKPVAAAAVAAAAPAVAEAAAPADEEVVDTAAEAPVVEEAPAVEAPAVDEAPAADDAPAADADASTDAAAAEGTSAE
ncbi:MAG: 50S ribosomal protein L17 [Candidatus Kapabacteria bacterium]|nr:50S ribosomal protein L17 [Candidatus Kapabacteria bacterium]